MGAGGKGGGGGANAASQMQAQLAQQLFQESTPLRQLLLGAPPVAGAQAAPGMLQTQLNNPPNFPFERDVLESQFGRAREDILASTPSRGGGLNTALANLASQRALGVTGLAQAQEQQRINNLFQTAGLTTGQTQVSLGGLGQAGTTLAAAGAARQQSQLAALGGLGTGIGTMIGAGKAPGSVKAA